MSDRRGDHDQMRSPRSLETVYLGLAILGAALPLAAFLPWVAANGLAPDRFVDNLFANRIGAFFGWDVIISAVVVLVTVTWRGDHLTSRQRWGVVAGTLLVGVSLGMPLLLYFQERHQRSHA